VEKSLGCLAKRDVRKVGVSVLVFTLALAMGVQVANALSLKNVTVWQSLLNDTIVNSVAVGCVDGDGKAEIVTGGYCGGYRTYCQLCVWDGATLALQKSTEWIWLGGQEILTVAIGDVDADGAVEIVTGGYTLLGFGHMAQLCVWNGATLALERHTEWNWASSTYVYSVAIGCVDGDGKAEIVTGGHIYASGTAPYYTAQLCVWDGATLALETVKTWQWVGGTFISSVAIWCVDADGKAEIVTGGYCGTYEQLAQLCVWDGATLALQGVKAWYWGYGSIVASVAARCVDGDGQAEIVTGGRFDEGSSWVAQLAVWNGATLAVENVKTWQWESDTEINSVAIGCVDVDGKPEIITGGDYNYGEHHTGPSVAQLVAWDGETLALNGVKTWQWTTDTYISSVAVGDVDGYGNEMITGGDYDSYSMAQLCVWT